ncbi:uncharacterized protein LOC127097239 [Lathyrus oleraceus]|uniref:uncharacterized protein LOC127097239 n=1 Tax=Pisum sativum TaxID=3888 RepID=UPI001FC3D2B8|nr:uncharacterized protein LOC127097239 [Pisum sativum]
MADPRDMPVSKCNSYKVERAMGKTGVSGPYRIRRRLRVAHFDLLLWFSVVVVTSSLVSLMKEDDDVVGSFTEMNPEASSARVRVRDEDSRWMLMLQVVEFVVAAWLCSPCRSCSHSLLNCCGLAVWLEIM